MLISLAVLLLAACGGGEDEPKPQQEQAPITVTPESPGNNENEDDNMKTEQTKINILIGDTDISGYLNNTRTARELKARLPFTTTVSKSEYDFCGTAEELPTDDSERQAGWKNGDIGHSHGWLALFHSGEEESSSYTSEMIVGHMEDSAIPVLRKMNGSYRVTITLAE